MEKCFFAYREKGVKRSLLVRYNIQRGLFWHGFYWGTGRMVYKGFFCVGGGGWVVTSSLSNIKNRVLPLRGELLILVFGRKQCIKKCKYKEKNNPKT